MSTIIHDAVVVSAFTHEHVKLAHKRAVELGLIVSPIVTSHSNGWQSFMIAPDGSGESWPPSAEFDTARAAWLEWAHDQNINGDVHLDFVHVRFGMDAGAATVSTSSNHARPGDLCVQCGKSREWHAEHRPRHVFKVKA